MEKQDSLDQLIQKIINGPPSPSFFIHGHLEMFIASQAVKINIPLMGGGTF